VIRRRSAVLAAMLALTALSSCATFNRNDIAAQVGTATLTNDDVSAMVRSDLYSKVMRTGKIDHLAGGDGIRSIIGAWVTLHSIEQSGALQGVDRTAIIQQLEGRDSTSWASAPQTLRDLLVINDALTSVASSGTVDSSTFDQAVTGADAYVDPRYGRWDPATGSVVPLTS
jgi:hypothetical protein